MLEDPLIECGFRVYHIVPMRKNRKQHFAQLAKIFKENKYDAIQDHGGYKAFLNFRIAKKYGVKVRIAHSHQANVKESYTQKFIRNVSSWLTKLYSTQLASCGIDAGVWMWGKRIFDKGLVHVVPNAIDISSFLFSNCIRTRIKKEMGLENKIVIGNIARFSEQKNHSFLIDVFEKIHQKNKNFILVLVGGGDLLTDIRNYVEEKGLSKFVIFLGVKNNVHELLNVFDLFVLPSVFEGLPVSIVEAQANGLPCILSDTITQEVKVNENVYYISLENGSSCWCDYILNNNFCRLASPDLIMSNYNIDNAVPMLEQFYFDQIMNIRCK